MRFVLAAAALAALTVTASAEPTYVQGGPLRQGNMCNISTNSDGLYGYVAPCAPTVAVKKKKRS